MRKPDKDVFCLGSAVDDEDDAKEGDAGDDADVVDIGMMMMMMMMKRNPYKVCGFCCG